MELQEYPRWVIDIVRPGSRGGDQELLRAAIAVARANLRETGGGPFGAIVATDEGEVVSIGYNLVVPERDSTAHAEVVALRRAERALGNHHLRAPDLPRLKLLTTCAPCLMCLGAIHWAGVPLVIASARGEDAEAVGFIEGTRGFDAVAFLRDRGIEYRADVLREEGVALLREYAGPIYNG